MIIEAADNPLFTLFAPTRAATNIAGICLHPEEAQTRVPQTAKASMLPEPFWEGCHWWKWGGLKLGLVKVLLADLHACLRACLRALERACFALLCFALLCLAWLGSAWLGLAWLACLPYGSGEKTRSSRTTIPEIAEQGKSTRWRKGIHQSHVHLPQTNPKPVPQEFVRQGFTV